MKYEHKRGNPLYILL